METGILREYSDKSQVITPDRIYDMCKRSEEAMQSIRKLNKVKSGNPI